MKEIFEVRTTDSKPKVTTYFAGFEILDKKEFFSETQLLLSKIEF